MAFVGTGQGAYTVETVYKFVGEGAGEYSNVPLRGSSGYAGVICGASMALLAVLAVVAMLYFVSPTTTTTLQQVAGPPRSCVIWGDPHIDSFDHSVASVYDEGQYWLVNSQTVWIQGRFLATPFTRGLAATHAIAVGGHFLQGHTVVVGPLESGKILVDGKPALTTFPSQQEVGALAKLTYDGQAKVVDDSMSAEDKHVVHMDLPSGVRIEIMRWANHVNARITMMSQWNGQQGLCGNMNGNAQDDKDANSGSAAHLVPQSASLFRHNAPPMPAPQHTLADCKKDPEKYDKASTLCSGPPYSTRHDLKLACLFDVCFAGPQYAMQDGWAASIEH